MIKESKAPIFKILANLPKNTRILDIGGASAPFKRATNIIDAVPFENINWSQAKGEGEVMFDKNSYTQFDICAREKWPFADKEFDYSTCSHVLEDIRDPLWVCSEIIRVSKAGYIEIPSKLYETTFGLEAKNLAGASHHRWLVDLYDNKLRFTFKYFYVHSHSVNKNYKKVNLKNESMYLKLEWSDSFSCFENWLNSGKEIFEFFLDIKITDKEMWRIFRKNSSKNIAFKWLAYLKNTNPLFKNIFNKVTK
ncbi:MAG: methyltransferase domain-containing protein [Candidatus Paceibacterota bacterium]|jgi:hypothetical protein